MHASMYVCVCINVYSIVSLQINVYVQQSAYFQYPAILSNNTACHCPKSTKSFTIHNFTGIFSLYWILLINNTTVLLLIPILDRIVYPLCCPWVPSMFSRMGVGVVASLVSIFCAIAVEVVRIHWPLLGVNVLLYQTTFSVNIPVGVMAPQLFIQGAAECLTLITGVCSDVYLCRMLAGSLCVQVWYCSNTMLHSLA